MSKRKVTFAEEDEALEKAFNDGASGDHSSDKATRFKEKHSLDSDEEDDSGKYEVMHEDDIEGQEEGNLDIIDGIKMTPFNMREELEEGHFDTEGTYIFKKENLIQDNWIENIDWVKVKEGQKKIDDKDSESEDDTQEPFCERVVMSQMLELMKSGENVLKSLKRLGGGKAGAAAASASQRWKAKRAKQKADSSTSSSEVDAAEMAKNREGLLKLTELADQFMQHGNLEVYHDTYEKIKFKLQATEEKEAAQKVTVPEETSADDALDMFADDIDTKKSNVKTDQASEAKNASNPDGGGATAGEDMDKDMGVRWEYKWENTDDAQVHGPFTTAQMANWKDEDFFRTGVYVKKAGADGPFYTSNRMDFELYL